MARNPKRVSMVSVIIALAVGFGIFMTTMIGTSMHGKELEARAKIGADLHVASNMENLSFGDELKNIEGINGVVPVIWVEGKLLEGDDYSKRVITIFNSTKYQNHVEVNDYFFVEGNPKKALKSISNGNAVIIGERIAQAYSLNVGSLVKITELSKPNDDGTMNDDFLILKSSTFKVAGIARALPGLEFFEYYDRGWGEAIYMDFSALETSLSDTSGGWHFLVDVGKGYNSKDVENAIYENFSASILEIKNLDTTLEEIRTDMPSNSILFIMLVNIGFMIIIITIGLGLILFITISERKNEFATMMARGAEGKHIATLIVGEAFSITLVGAVVGVFKMLSTNTLFGTSGDMLSERPLIIPWYGVLIIILALLALIVTSIIAAFMARRIKLHQALRIRGG
jgi:ABC-type antimicrobial peptide transport system permease subunit